MDNSENKEKRSILSRVIAIILLAIYAVFLGIFIYFVITGSKYILAMLFVIIVYPVSLYLIFWIRKVFGGNNTDDK